MMPKKQTWLIALLMLASAIAGGISSSGLSLISMAGAQRNTNAVKPIARRYEYQSYIAAGPQDLADQASKLADDGWELFEVITDQRVVTRYIGFFKRQRQ
jgi:hypothetical protein